MSDLCIAYRFSPTYSENTKVSSSNSWKSISKWNAKFKLGARDQVWLGANPRYGLAEGYLYQYAIKHYLSLIPKGHARVLEKCRFETFKGAWSEFFNNLRVLVWFFHTWFLTLYERSLSYHNIIKRPLKSTQFLQHTVPQKSLVRMWGLQGVPTVCWRREIESV